jgi:hypothetical protein
MADDGYIWCRVHTHASLPTYIDPREREPGDVDTNATARGDNARDREIAGMMAGQIGSGQSSGAWAYLRELRRMEKGD